MVRRDGIAAFAAVLLGGACVLSLSGIVATAEPSPEPPKAEAVPAPQAAAAEVNPMVAAVRQKISQTTASGAERDDLNALGAFYASAAAPLWVSEAGFTMRAEKALAEIRKADDWGLEAKAFALPVLAEGEKSPQALAEAEVKLGLAALKYARFARGGRVDPAKLSKYIDVKLTFVEPKLVLERLAATPDADAVLRDLHPKHEQFRLLQKALVAAREPAKPAEKPAEPAVAQLSASGPVLKPGVRHADVVVLRQRLGVVAEAGREDHFDGKLLDAVKAFQKERKLESNGVVNARTRAALAGTVETAAKPDPQKDVERIILSMERWRWAPEDMGQMHVWDNIPEFMTRVVKNGQVVHQERIIVGKTNTPTPVFSAKMQFVIFHPDWGVPDSIKVKEILPYLRRPAEDSFFGFGGGADTRVLQRHNLKVTMNGRPVDASQVDWSSVDIRQFQFTQPPGGSNVLGVVKFRFPNRHDVYMHDTPQRELFNTKVRTYSHGCVRVHNPQRLAEVVLGEEGMSADEINGLIKGSAKTEITLKNQLPVHITYFTAVVQADGKVETFPDIYGHDGRLALALAGKQTEFFDPVDVTDTPALSRQARMRKAKESSPASFLSGLFGN